MRSPIKGNDARFDEASCTRVIQTTSSASQTTAPFFTFTSRVGRFRTARCCEEAAAVSVLSAGLLQNIQHRYEQQSIYTYTAMILVAVNPYARELFRRALTNYMMERPEHMLFWCTATSAYRRCTKIWISTEARPSACCRHTCNEPHSLLSFPQASRINRQLALLCEQPCHALPYHAVRVDRSAQICRRRPRTSYDTLRAAESDVLLPAAPFCCAAAAAVRPALCPKS